MSTVTALPAVAKRSRRTGSQTTVTTTLPSKPANETWTRDQWIAMTTHLHNDNGEHDFILGWYGPNSRNGGKVEPVYARSSRIAIEKGITWAWSSLSGKGKKKVAVVLYAKNREGMSRWAGLDVDAHGLDANIEEAHHRAVALFRAAINIPEVYTIFEHSGRGYHVWLISRNFQPCSKWTALLQSVLSNCGFVEDGTIELFPHAGIEGNKFGKGLRAPGCWSPATQRPSLILWENISDFLRETATPVPLKEKNISFSSSFLPLYPRLLGSLETYRIFKTSTRRNLLLKLTGILFNQVGHDMARAFAKAQYDGKKIFTAADEAEHLREFESFWHGLYRRWRVDLSPSELLCYEGLTTDAEREAYRIIRSYAMNACESGRVDFPVARDDLAGRIGITGRGAGQLIARFIAAGILKRTAEYVPHQTAARYRWLNLKERENT